VITVTDEELLLRLSSNSSIRRKEAIDCYFEAVATKPFQVDLRLRKNVNLILTGAWAPLASPGELAAQASVGTALVNWWESAGRLNRYKRDKAAGKVRIVSEGDSWFQHPLLSDIIDHLEGDYAVRSLGRAGDELADMKKQNQFLRAIKQETPRFFLLSGGGNDTIGENFHKWLRPASKHLSGDSVDRYLWLDKFQEHVANLMGILSEIFTSVRALPNAPDIIVHGYDRALPVAFEDTSDRRVVGIGKSSWLSGPLDKAKVREESDRRAIVSRLIDLYNQALASTVERFDSGVHYINLRDQMGSADEWHDELHPSSSSAARLAEKFRDCLASLPHKTPIPRRRRRAPTKPGVRLPWTRVEERATRSERLAVAAQPTDVVPWGQRLLGLPDVWARTGGQGVRVALLDSGVAAEHIDLEGAFAPDGIQDFTGEGPRDQSGHGTHCAGIIGARANDTGIVGVAPLCTLMSAKVLRADGTGNVFALIDALAWAVDAGADIVSLSLSAESSTPELYVAVHNALTRGVHIICAAGNSGALAQNNIGYPARYGSVITVGAHDRNGNPAGFSSRGGEIDVSAPGSDIWSTAPDGDYAKLSGTSMAAPFVAGLSALILSKHRHDTSSRTPIENTADLKEHLLRMAAHPGHHNNASGYGALAPLRYFSTL